MTVPGCQSPLLLSPALNLVLDTLLLGLWRPSAENSGRQTCQAGRAPWPPGDGALRARGGGCTLLPFGAELGGTLTVHVISMLFFLVPSPFTSPGLDSGAGTQMDTKFKPELCLTRAW